MAIPLISNVGFTEVSSSGVLNDKASTGANKPVSYTHLTLPTTPYV